MREARLPQIGETVIYTFREAEQRKYNGALVCPAIIVQTWPPFTYSNLKLVYWCGFRDEGSVRHGFGPGEFHYPGEEPGDLPTTDKNTDGGVA